MPGTAAQLPDLTSCETEPIRTPGAVQPFGVLLALDPNTLIVRHASTNWRDAFGDTDPLGSSSAALLGTAAESALLLGISRGDLTDPTQIPVEIPGTSAGSWLATAHTLDGLAFVELEAVGNAVASPLGRLATVRAAFARLSAAAGIAEFCAAAAREVRALLGFDRVMVYRFDARWNGEVVAEEKRADMESFLGLHFPASDIPAQARALYLANRVRVIPDVAYTPVPVVPAHDRRTGQPLNLSRCVLRSVSPVHREYLGNMGVRGSLTTFLAVDGRLWGLIACHHSSPKRVSSVEREACDLLAEMASTRLALLHGAEEQAEVSEAAKVLSRMAKRIDRSTPAIAGLAKDEADLLTFVKARGAVIWRAGRGVLIGLTPPAEELANLISWLRKFTSPIISTDQLSQLYPPASEYADMASGLLAVEVSRDADEFVLWFRPEVLHTVNWAGDPQDKAGPDGRLSPRQSFALWSESVRGQSSPWRPPELANAERVKELLLTAASRSTVQLEALLPICAWCKKVRDEPGYWRRVEDFIRDLVDVRFTHSMCPECSDKQVAELDELEAKAAKKKAGGSSWK